MEQANETGITIYSDDGRLCESPISPERPKRLDAASPWRDHIGDSKDAIQFLPRIPEVEQSSTHNDQGESTHLQNALDNHPSNPEDYHILRTDEWLTAVGAGIYSRDAHFEFSDIPLVELKDKILEDQLRNAIRKYPRNDGQKFIPIGDFDKIITRESIRRDVKSWLPEDRDLEVWVSSIWDTFYYEHHITTRPRAFTSRRKIFAILVLLNAQPKIASFIREGLFDKDLPFIQNSKNEWVYYPHKSQAVSRSVKSLNQLEKRDTDSFDNYQWFMLSPIFDMTGGRVIHYDLHRRITLPFLEHDLGHNPTLIGGQGEVSRIKMHESHYISTKTIKDLPDYFAIKKLTSPDKGQFNSEVESLKRFSNDDHPHLIKLLATYHHEEKFHLIFPWADGNLRDLWKRCPHPTKSYSTVLWVADQCRGIAKGLRMIHNNEFKSGKTSLSPNERKKGRHGDMKPENILWFKGPVGNGQFENDVLKISDFGLTRWHGSISNDQTDIQKLAVSRSYRAPEYDLYRPVSQAWDIWSLACLYLEFITWYLCGWEEGVDEFSKDRTRENSALVREGNYAISEDHFFNLATKNGSETNLKAKYEASLKLSVISWINKLHATEGCSEFIHDFLDLISDNMLRIGSDKRIQCEDVASILDTWYNRCQDENYCSKSKECTRKKKRNNSDPPDVLDTTTIEYSEKTAKRLSQRISLQSIPRASSDYHDQGIGTEPIEPTHFQFDGQNAQPCPSLSDSNQPTLGSRRFESDSLTTPVLEGRPTTGQATGPEDIEHSSQQTLSGDSQRSNISLPTNYQENTDSISHGLSTIEQTRASSRISQQGGTLSPPSDYRIGCTPSERDGASSQTTQRNSQIDTGNIDEKRHKSIWKKFQEWVKSVACLGERS